MFKNIYKKYNEFCLLKNSKCIIPSVVYIADKNGNEVDRTNAFKSMHGEDPHEYQIMDDTDEVLELYMTAINTLHAEVQGSNFSEFSIDKLKEMDKVFSCNKQNYNHKDLRLLQEYKKMIDLFFPENMNYQNIIIFKVQDEINRILRMEEQKKKEREELKKQCVEFDEMINTLKENGATIVFDNIKYKGKSVQIYGRHVDRVTPELRELMEMTGG